MKCYIATPMSMKIYQFANLKIFNEYF